MGQIEQRNADIPYGGKLTPNRGKISFFDFFTGIIDFLWTFFRKNADILYGNKSKHGTTVKTKMRLTSKITEKNTKPWHKNRVVGKDTIGKETYSVHGFIKYVLAAKIQAFKDGRKTEYTSRGTGQERHILPRNLLIL